MALITPSPTNPTIGTATADVPASLASAFRPNINTAKSTLDAKALLLGAYLELLTTAIGNGALPGGYGLITAGTGLSVNVATLIAFVGTWIEYSGSQVVGGLTDSAVNFLFLRQDGTWTVAATNTKPGSGDGHGDALLWGTATCAGGVVTAISNQRDVFRLQTPLNLQRDTINDSETVLITDGFQTTLIDSVTAYGTLTNYGKVRVQ